MVYGEEEEENGKTDEAYYKLVRKNYQQDYTFYQTTIDTVSQQLQENNTAHLIKMHFSKKLEDFVITDRTGRGYITKVYARFINGVLEPEHDERHLGWLDINPL